MITNDKYDLVMKLRQKQMSYSQIKSQTKVSKSTLTRWLSGHPLSKKRIQELRDTNSQRIEKYRETMRKKRETMLLKYYLGEKKKLIPLTTDELYLSGLFLYWGEGAKSTRHCISICNTDPTVIKFALFWMVKYLNISKNMIKVQLHLYSDMEIDKEISYWKKQLNMPPSNFVKPYIKKSSKKAINQKGFGHGTCTIYHNNTLIKNQILMGIKCISDYYSQKATKL